MLSLLGDPKPRTLLQAGFTQNLAEVSPDGKWLAYDSNESGTYEVYVRSLPDLNGKWQVSQGGGAYPRWRRDGKELYYYAAGDRLMAVAIDGKGALEIGPPAVLFETHLLNGVQITFGFRDQYEVTHDGQHFLLNIPLDEDTPSPITVVLNWMNGMVEVMTRDEIAAMFARREEAFEEMDAAALAVDYADDAIIDSPVGGTHRGPAAAAHVFDGLFHAFADHTRRIEDLIIDGNRVVQVLILQGTNLGGFLGLPPSGKHFRVPAVFLYGSMGIDRARARIFGTGCRAGWCSESTPRLKGQPRRATKSRSFAPRRYSTTRTSRR
jgi:hypothetical protein